MEKQVFKSIDKNDGCIPTSDEDIMTDDDFESDSDYCSVCWE